MEGSSQRKLERSTTLSSGCRRWVLVTAQAECVLNGQECEAITKAGTHWDDIHLHAHKVLIETFLKIGIFKDADMDSLLKSGLSCAFYPHGLGHSIGLDVHDSYVLFSSLWLLSLLPFLSSL